MKEKASNNSSSNQNFNEYKLFFNIYLLNKVTSFKNKDDSTVVSNCSFLSRI